MMYNSTYCPYTCNAQTTRTYSLVATEFYPLKYGTMDYSTLVSMHAYCLLFNRSAASFGRRRVELQRQNDEESGNQGARWV